MRRLLLLLSTVALAGVLSQVAMAEDEGDKPYLQLSGFYAFNGYSQNNFFLGRSAARVDSTGTVGGLSDQDNYAIQLFRLMMKFGMGPNVKAVVRADIAQGFWGIDNGERDADGGFSPLFNNKDTNFITHWDWAYLDASHPSYGLNAKLGRQKFTLGNLLVLDQNSDGVLLTKDLDDQGLFTVGWAKMSEGADGLSDEDALQGGQDAGDAHLFLARYQRQIRKKVELNPFFAYYTDGGDADDSTYLPNDLQYFRARFTPQISDVTVLGLAFKGGVERVTFKGELDILLGNDDVANANSGPLQVTDVNDGDLSGYNFYIDAKVDVGPGQAGLVLGMGSGDDDPMSGDGNINKIRTNGFFYVNEIWEDSVMPDEEGISPQGLGSPASRGYREFENTTLVQVNYSADVHPKLHAFVSGTWMKATQPVFAWAQAVDAEGAVSSLDGVPSDDDLGWELDGKLTWKLHPSLVWILRGGAFLPGDAAGYLINGSNEFDDVAWELRTTVKFSFSGLKFGG